MSRHKTRKNKTCLSCGHYVDKHYCPNCGQENIEPHMSFFYLFKHFIEDLFHYDSSFWKTIKHLLFSPNKLTSEYLSGKRKTYVEPVKLYIFISFVAFLIPPLLPDFSEPKEEKIADINITTKDSPDSAKDSLQWNINGYKSLAELDSVEQSLPKDKRLSLVEHYITKNILKYKDNASRKIIIEKIIEVFAHNFSKVLFFYMPVFALLLWLFHNKKRFYFYDSGIFTLHFFSFFLLLTTIFFIIECLLSSGNRGLFSFLKSINHLILILYPPIYFFIAHKRMYGESGFVSGLKSSMLVLLNFILIMVTLIGYAIITLMIVLS